MPRAMGYALFVLITHSMLVNSDLYPSGLGWAFLYGIGAVGFLSALGI